jgi:hypothetical protein
MFQEVFKARIALGAMLAAAVISANFAGVARAADEIPAVAIDKTAEGFVLSGDLPEGLVTVNFTNTTEAPTSPVLARLKEGETQETLMAAMAEDLFGALSKVTLLGGTMINPEASVEATFNLQPGEYALLDFAGEGAPTFFTVEDVEGEGVQTEVEYAVEVRLLDFAFGISPTVPAGAQTWYLTNAGAQWHEFVVMPIEEGTTVDQVIDMMLASAEGGDGPMPVAMWAPMEAGESAYVTFDLQPGTYAVVCYLPDLAGEGHPHIHKGMVQFIKVVAE